MSEAAIVCENLTRDYGSKRVVDSLSLSVPKNSVFGFLGPNGAGKSTTMKLLTGQIKPTSGDAWVAGVRVTSGSPESHKLMGYLAEQPNFYPWLRGYELLEWVGELYGMSRGDRQGRARELLRLVGLEEREAGGMKVGAYSGGMRQRLGIAQALVNRPAVIFLDEPVSALDPVGRRDVLQLLNNIRQEATVFMSSHVLADVDRVCDQVAILNHGQLIAAGPTLALKEQYANPTLEIEIEGGQEATRRLAAALRSDPQLKQVKETDDGRLNLEYVSEEALRQAGRNIPPLLAALGLTLVKYEAVVPGLEEIFMRLVGQPAEQPGEVTRPVEIAGRR